MSWQTINEILGLAIIDQSFAQQLLSDPLEALLRRGFHLTAEEQKTLCECQWETLQELSQYLIEKLGPSSSAHN